MKYSLNVEYPEVDENNQALWPEIFLRFAVRIGDDEPTDVPVSVGIAPKTKMIVVKMNAKLDPEAEAAALNQDETRVIDFAMAAAGAAIEIWKKEKGDWPWPSAHNTWMVLLEETQQIADRLGRSVVVKGAQRIQ